MFPQGCYLTEFASYSEPSADAAIGVCFYIVLDKATARTEKSREVSRSHSRAGKALR